jgi:anti-sigma factor ChrR (cupin superfamily)
METSPSDLAAAFRSFARRAREAAEEAAETGDEEARARAARGAATAAGHVRDAARLMQCQATGDLAKDGAVAAAAIDDVEPSYWEDATLDRLRELAAAAGKALRS